MANYNNNILKIHGAETLIAEIKTKIITINEAGEDTFSFHSIIPQDISQGSWADSDIWGTRTDADDYGTLDLEIKNDEIFMSFDTAWAPPIPVIAKLKEMFPAAQIELLYYEPGEGFAGQYDGVTDLCYYRHEKEGAKKYRNIVFNYFQEPDNLDDEDAALFLEENPHYSIKIITNNK